MKVRHIFSGIALALLGVMLVLIMAPACSATDTAPMTEKVIQVGDSEVIEVTDVSRVAIGDPLVADVLVLSPSEILLNAKSPGKTVLYTWTEAGKKMYRVIVEPVTVDMAKLTAAITKELDDPRITVRGIAYTVILEGTVSREAESSRAQAVAQAVVESTVFQGVAAGSKSQEVKSVSRPEGESFVLEKVVSDKDTTMSAQTGPRVPKVVNLIQVERAIDEVSVRTLAIAEAIRQGINNDPAITVRALPGGVVLLEGKVGTVSELDRINLILKGWEKESKDDKGGVEGSNDTKEVITMVNAVEIDTSVARQVMVRAQVIDINRDALKDFGVEWGRVIFGAGGASVDGGTWLIGQDGEGPFDIFGGGPIDRLDPIGARVRALEQQNKAKILSQPNLLVLDGCEANMLVGGEIPIPVPQSGSVGGTAITIEYKEFGVRLKILPTVTGNNTLQLKVMPEVSSLSSSGAIRINGFEVPALRTRKADTIVNVKDGQSLIIGGLLQNDDAKFINKIPVLGDLPIIGELFKSRSFQRNETELVIVITPQIMTPTAQYKEPK